MRGAVPPGGAGGAGRTGRAGGEQGLTLIELVVTIAIMGIAFATLLEGVLTTVKVSDVHRRQADAEAALRSFAEDVKGASFQPALSPVPISAATPCVTASYEASYTPPPGFTRRVTGCTWMAPPERLQRLDLEVASSDGRAVETVQVVKRG
jgi:prepilin-type N-terminal cleavage/methylation domain-containing protein